MRQISGLGPYQAEYYGVNGPKRGVDDQGRQVFFKVNRHADNASEVIGSHLLVDELGQLGVVADEAVSGADQGVCSQFLPNQRTLKAAGLDAVSNGEQLVGQVIFRDFLGDWDAHSANYLVGPDGTARAIDMGKTGNRGILGTSPTSIRHQVLSRFATTQLIQTHVERIRQFTDEEIQAMVGRAAAHLEHPAPAVEQKFVEALLYQRENYRKYDIYK